ncbi:MAG: lipopolysaccharide biosynthesis protein [Gammaproteobacteria bacterium]|nr:lipopolysaccharide biosynthesis protein [Gammaproteobacteria bacterium]
MLKGPVASATIRTSIVMSMRLVLQAGSLLLIARVLGPYQFGAFAGIAALAILLGALSTFGTPTMLLAEASQAFRRRLRVLPYCVSTTLIAGTLLLALFIVVVMLVFPGSPVPLGLAMVIGATELLVQPLLMFPSVQLQARRNIALSQLVYLAPLSIRFAIVLAIFLEPVEHPLATIVTGNLLAGLAGLLIATRLSPDAWPAFRHWRIAKLSELRRAAGFAVLSITTRGPTEIDKSLAARLLPLATAGVYSGAARMINAVGLPVNAMLHAVTPTLFQEARTAGGIRPRMLTTMFAAAFLYGSGAAFLMWLFVPAIAWLFGDAYEGIGHAVSLLCIAIPGITLRMTCGVILVARERPWERVFVEASGVAVVVAAAIYFVPSFGIVGMIGAYVAAEWLMAIMAAGLVVRQRAVT